MVGSVTQSLQAQNLGTVRTYFTTGIVGSGNGALNHSHGLGYDTTNNTVWVTDHELGNDIFEFDATQSDGATLVPLTRLCVPNNGKIEGLGYDDTDDTLWYIDKIGTVRHITKTGVLLGAFPTSGLFGLAVQCDFIWVDDGGTAFKYQKDGTFTGVTIPSVRFAFGLAYDDDHDLIWTGHWITGQFAAYDQTTGALVFQSAGLVLPNGNGQGHNLGYGAGKLWVATESLSADVIYSIEVNGFDSRPGDCAIEVAVDIKPGSCPNSFNRGNPGNLPVAVLGTAEIDVTLIDLSTVQLSRSDGFGGFVNAIRPAFEDVATVFDGDLCDCHELGGDGVVDLSIKFPSLLVTSVLQLDEFSKNDLVLLDVTGALLDGTEFRGRDCIRIVK